MTDTDTGSSPVKKFKELTHIIYLYVNDTKTQLIEICSSAMQDLVDFFCGGVAPRASMTVLQSTVTALP